MTNHNRDWLTGWQINYSICCRIQKDVQASSLTLFNLKFIQNDVQAWPFSVSSWFKKTSKLDFIQSQIDSKRGADLIQPQIDHSTLQFYILPINNEESSPCSLKNEDFFFSIHQF